MARDELLEITTDKWSDTVWDQRPPTRYKIDRPQLYFVWGDNDHWVQNSTRDEIILNHARRTGKAVPDSFGQPYMEVDDSNIPHDFCIRKLLLAKRAGHSLTWEQEPEHSKRMAEKVSEFVRDALAFMRVDSDLSHD